jgi:hypothetical protein
MRFERLPLEQAAGQILGHNVYDASGRRVLRKGRALSEDDVERLAALGRRSIYVARLEEGDVSEDRAAARIAGAAAGAAPSRGSTRQVEGPAAHAHSQESWTARRALTPSPSSPRANADRRSAGQRSSLEFRGVQCPLRRRRRAQP